MKYTIIYTNTNTNRTTRCDAYAPDLATVRKFAYSPLFCHDGESCRIYSDITTGDGIQEASLQIVKRTTANMINREGGDIQYRLYNACRVKHIDDPDIMDCMQVAALALCDAVADGVDVVDAYHSAYLSLNRHLHASRQIHLSVTAMRTVYIEDIDGDIINVNKDIARIVKKSDIITDTDMQDDPTDISKLSYIISDIMEGLTPPQKQVLEYLARGYSERQIANAMNRSKTTIHEHKLNITKKAKAKYPNGVILGIVEE